MKILHNNVLYVQNKDFFTLFNLNLPVPPSTYCEFFQNNLVVLIDKNNKQDFIAIKNREAINTLLNFDFILDYNKIKDLNEEELMVYRKKLTDRLHEIYNELYYNKFLDLKEKYHLRLQYLLINEEVIALDEYIQFLNGNIQLLLPDGVEYPKHFVQGTIKKSLEYQGKNKLDKILKKASKMLKNRKR